MLCRASFTSSHICGILTTLSHDAHSPVMSWQENPHGVQMNRKEEQRPTKTPNGKFRLVMNAQK